MANEATTTTATEFVMTEFIRELIIRAAYSGSKFKPYILTAGLDGERTRTMEFPKSPLLTAVGLTEGNDQANSAFNPTSVTVAAGEVGLMITPTDVLMGSAITGVDYFVEQLGFAIATKEDLDIAACASSFTTSVGTSGADMTETNLFDALYQLANGNAQAPLGYWAGVHPIQMRDLQVDIATSPGAIWGASAGPGGLGQIGERAMFYGVLFIASTNVPTANGGADRNGFIAPIGPNCGIAHVEKRLPRVEAQRDASLRATELVGTGDYGAGCVNVAANGGIGIITDA